MKESSERNQAYAAQHKCIYCEQPCSTSRMHFHHDSLMECVDNLRAQVSELMGHPVLIFSGSVPIDEAALQATIDSFQNGKAVILPMLNSVVRDRDTDDPIAVYANDVALERENDSGTDATYWNDSLEAVHDTSYVSVDDE